MGSSTPRVVLMLHVLFEWACNPFCRKASLPSKRLEKTQTHFGFTGWGFIANDRVGYSVDRVSVPDDLTGVLTLAGLSLDLD